MKLLTCDDEQLPRSWAPLFQKLTRTYLILSIPVVALFVCSSGVRFAAAQALARGGSSVIPISRVFCGDLYTRDGGVWGWRIAANPFGTLNLADARVASWQFVQQVRDALDHRPKTIYASIGRFDIDDPNYDESRTLEHLRQALELANHEGTHLVLTLAPYGSNSVTNTKLASLNERIEQELEDATILDLNNTIAPQGTLLTRFTSDGEHLNEAAYDAWASMVKATMAGGDTFRPAETGGGKARR